MKRRRLFAIALFCWIFASRCAVSAAGGVLNDTSIPLAVDSFGHTPQWVYRHFGKPVFVEREGYCCSFAGYKAGTSVLVQSYDLLDGGRIGFVYGQRLHSSTWTVVGFVYDSLHSPTREPISRFFPTGAPREQRLFTCYEQDFYHAGSGHVSALSTYAAWSAPNGRLIFARYLVGKNAPRRYDAVTGRDVLVPITNLDALPMVQLGYFQSPRGIMDLHIARDDDFSITTAYHTCFR
ncbi:MAG: hypothetical protein ACYDDQ_02380 [Vulcanimicrobiaceae bacterium]